MIVVDANVLVRALTDSTALGEAARVELARDEEWIAPPHMLIEVLRTLARLERGGHLTPEQAHEFASAAMDARIEYVPVAGWHAEAAWTMRHNFSAYDAIYVTIAEMHDAPLVTFDGRLARAVEKHSSITVIVPTEQEESDHDDNEPGDAADR